MRKYSKKIALILVLALTLVAAVPVLAKTSDTVITGRYKDIQIEVVVPSSTTAIINPYGLPMDITDDNGASLGKVSDNQIITATPLVGYSMCEVPVDINVTVTGEPQGDFRLALEKPTTTDTTKSGLVYFEIKPVNDLGYSGSTDTNPIGKLVGSKVYTELKNWSKGSYSASATNQVLVGTRAVTTTTPVCKLNAAQTDTNGKVTGPATTNGYFVARLNGDIVGTPRDEWVTSDGVNVTISWIITPSKTTTP